MKSYVKHLKSSVVSIFLALALITSLFSLPTQEAHANRISATCSNTLSDASTINSAISSSNSGDEIVIQGQCLINQVITLLGDRSYRGQSRSGTVLRQANGANLQGILASDSYMSNSSTGGLPLSIRQLTIDGNSANNTARTDGIILRSWQSVVSDVQIMNMGGNGIHLSNKSLNGTTTLTNTMVNGQINGNFITNTGGSGIWNDDAANFSITDWQLQDNWIAYSGEDGINLKNAAGWNVERNHIYGIQKNAIWADKLWGTTIADNYIEDFGSTSTAGTYYGLGVVLQGGVASQISGNKIFNINTNEGNTSSWYRYMGIFVNYGTGNVSVTGNVIRGANTPRGTGMYYYAGSNAIVAASIGNLVTDVSTDRYVYGSGTTINSGI